MILQKHKNIKTQRIKGFTLMELMVVVGIVAILSWVAGPYIKKVYEDYKVYETYESIDYFISSQRAHYLIMNEGSYGCGYARYIRKSLSCFLPPHMFRRTPWSTRVSGMETYDTFFMLAIPDPYLCVNWYRVHGMQIHLYIKGSNEKGKPFYYDDLAKRYTQKGFKVSVGSLIVINFPEVGLANTIDSGGYIVPEKNMYR